jgi:hypothetical protein
MSSFHTALMRFYNKTLQTGPDVGKVTSGRRPSRHAVAASSSRYWWPDIEFGSRSAAPNAFSVVRALADAAVPLAAQVYLGGFDTEHQAALVRVPRRLVILMSERVHPRSGNSNCLLCDSCVRAANAWARFRAQAYDIAAVKFRGPEAATNFDIRNYDVHVSQLAQVGPALDGRNKRRCLAQD